MSASIHRLESKEITRFQQVFKQESGYSNTNLEQTDLKRDVWAVWCIKNVEIFTSQSYFTQRIITNTWTIWHIQGFQKRAGSGRRSNCCIWKLVTRSYIELTQKGAIKHSMRHATTLQWQLLKLRAPTRQNTSAQIPEAGFTYLG